MIPTFELLTESYLARALDLRRQLYVHEDLVYEEGNAAELMRELMANSGFGALWLIAADGEICGYALLTLCYSLEFGGRFGLLDEFYLEPHRRGNGIGAAVLSFLDSECRSRGLRALRLEVSHTNPRALELYRRSGYAIESRHLMTKWL